MFPIRYLQKALQRRLQPVSMEVISIDQSTFFFLHHSLDGILLVHETLEWAKTSNQNLIFLKLDFSKAFDKVFWAFSFQCLEKIKLLQGVIQFVRILFVGVETLCTWTGSFQGLFQFWRESSRVICWPHTCSYWWGRLSTSLSKLRLKLRNFWGFPYRIQAASKWHVLYNKMWKGLVENLVATLKLLGTACNLEINWGNCVAFFQGTCQAMPNWLNHFQWKWAREKTSPSS